MRRIVSKAGAGVRRLLTNPAVRVIMKGKKGSPEDQFPGIPPKRSKIMTIIEFFDKTAIENIAGALLCAPERVIFVGDNQRRMAKSIALYEELLAAKGIGTALGYKAVNKNNLQNIVDILMETVEEHEDCVFDLTGGEDLYLVAMGIVIERCRGRVRFHRFNFRNESLMDCDADGKICATKSLDISVYDSISMCGGAVVTDPTQPIYTHEWDLTPLFRDDVETMWEICRRDARLWNAHVSTVGKLAEIFPAEDSLTLAFEKEFAETVLKRLGMKYACIPGILFDLQKHGLIRRLVVGDRISFVFKNEQVKRCLTVAGQVLELTVAARLQGLKDKDGQPLYHDVKVGVVIDWDAEDEAEEVRTVNEIDVIAMKGAVPVYISCKNGFFDANELYKLDTVAKHFGGEYAKKVLVTTELDKLGERAEYLRARMQDMSIRCVENLDEKSESEIDRILRSLWNN